MATTFQHVAMWLADMHLLSGMLLAAALSVIAMLRQPARRMAVEKATLAGLSALALLSALPGWSAVHLLAAKPQAASSGAAPVESARLEQPTPAPLIDVPAIQGPPAQLAAAPAEPIETESPPWSWPEFFVTAHALGSMMVITWLCVGALFAARLRRRSRPASAEARELLQSLAGDGRAPQLFVSDAIAAPVALGVRRPTILLPGSMATAEPHEMAAILAHEWAHIAGGDLKTLAAGRLLLVLLWPQPLAWLLRRAVRMDQETLADAAGAEVAGRVDYAQQLVAWARGDANGAGPRGRAPRLAGAVGLWEGPSQLKRRVAALLDDKLTVLRECSRRWRVCTAALAVVGAAVLSLVTLQREEAAAQSAAEPVQFDLQVDDAPKVDATQEEPTDVAEPTREQGESVMLEIGGYYSRENAEPNVVAGHCLDQNRRPLAGVQVTLVRGAFWNNQKEKLGEATTNERGEFRFENVVDLAAMYPDGEIPESSDPTEPMIVCAAQLPGRTSREAAAPQQYIARQGQSIDFVMPSGSVLRGRISDEGGRPIEGVLVAKSPHMSRVEGMWAARTDANGVYEIGDLRPFDLEADRRRAAEERARAAGKDGFTLSVSTAPVFVVTHPDYGFRRLTPTTIPGKLDAKLSAGGRIVGRVTSPDGKPAGGVTVRIYTSVPRRANDDGIPSFNHGAVSIDGMYMATQRTRADGTYEFAGLAPGMFDVWTESPGWFDPGQGEVKVEAGATTKVDLTPTRGGTIRVQFVDAATGEPLRPGDALHVKLSVMRKDQLSRQDAWPIEATVNAVGRATVGAVPGRARLLVQSPLMFDGTPQWEVAQPVGYVDAPVVDVVDGETVDVTIEVAPAKSVSAEEELNTLGGAAVAVDQVATTYQDAAEADDAVDGEAPTTTHGAVGVARFAAVSEKDGTIAGEAVDPAAVPNSFIVKCVDATGAPLASVRATIYRVEYRNGLREHVADAESDASGEVRFADLAPPERLELYRASRKSGEPNQELWQRLYMVTLRRDGLATKILANQEFPLATRGYRAEVKLEPGQRLAGRVTAPTGKPVANALVAAGGMASMITIEGVNAVRTDADGRFEFADRPALDAKVAAAQMNQNMFLSTAALDFKPATAPRRAVGEDWSASNLVVTHPDFAVTRVHGGDIPGEVNVTMAPAAAVVGRVVSVDGAAVPMMRVRIQSRPDVGVRPDGVVFRIAIDTPFDGSSSTATTLTDAEGRYRIGNLPAGVYDVWAAPASDDPEQSSLVNLGIGGLVLVVGEPKAAPDLVVGPGGTVHGQLIDASTGSPPTIGPGARAAVAYMLQGGPQMQDHLQQQVDVSSDGTFTCRVPPGKLRVTLFAYDGKPANLNEPAYMTPDDSHARGPLIDLAHGESADVRFEVWPHAKLQEQRAERSKLWETAEKDKTAGIVAYTQYLAKYPDNYEAMVHRAILEIDLKQWAAAVADMERVLELNPDEVNAQMTLANLLATSGDAAVRDGKRAIALATQAAAELREREFTNTGALTATLSYLAAAYAETGDFERAITTQREVIELTPTDQRKDAEERLKLYESGKPFHRE